MSYYIYVFYDLALIPRYVGISGADSRIEQHLKNSHNKRLRYKINSLQHQGIDIPWTKLVEGLTKEDACLRERCLIAGFGRLGIDKGGILYNITQGGEGFFGGKHSAETRKTMSTKAATYATTAEGKAAKSHASQVRWGKPGAHIRSPEHSAAISAALKGNVPWNKGLKPGHNPWPDGRPDFVPWNKGVPCTEEMKQRISETLTGRPGSSASRGKGKPKSEAHRQAISAARKGKPHPHKGRCTKTVGTINLDDLEI